MPFKNRLTIKEEVFYLGLIFSIRKDKSGGV